MIFTEEVNPKYHEAESLKIAYVNDLTSEDVLVCFSGSSTYVFFDFDKEGFCRVSSHDAIKSNGRRRFPGPVKARILGSNLGDSIIFANQIIKNTSLDIMYFDVKRNKIQDSVQHP